MLKSQMHYKLFSIVITRAIIAFVYTMKAQSKNIFIHSLLFFSFQLCLKKEFNGMCLIYDASVHFISPPTEIYVPQKLDDGDKPI